jgi:hypothetical protein
MLTAGGKSACPDTTNFNLEWDIDSFGNKIYTSNIWHHCEQLEANKGSCVSTYNNNYNLTEPKDGRQEIRSCKMDSSWLPWKWDDPYCTEDSTCRPPEGKGGVGDFYARLNSAKHVQLDFAPCAWSTPRFIGRMKNPDTTDGSYKAWANAENVCNKRGIDPNNEKCKHYNQTISCEKRSTKDDCEKVESGCSMYEGGSCCSWDSSKDVGKRCSKNVNGCNRHASFAECNSDPSKMCRWGPDEVDIDDYRSPGCYANKGWQDSYLNTINNTCRAPQFYDKNLLWKRTGEKDENGFSKCELTPPGKGPTVRYFGSKEECEGKIPLPIPEPPLPAPPPPPPPPSYKFSCLNTGHTQNCTAIPSWTEGIQSFPTKVECQLGTNYCGKGTDVVSSFTCLNTGHGKHCTQIPQGVPEGDLETFPTLLDCQVGTDYCGNGPP